MDVLEVHTGPPRDPLLMHQAGHVGRDHVLGSVAKVIVNLVQPLRADTASSVTEKVPRNRSSRPAGPRGRPPDLLLS